jgi:hypothetical protein
VHTTTINALIATAKQDIQQRLVSSLQQFEALWWELFPHASLKGQKISLCYACPCASRVDMQMHPANMQLRTAADERNSSTVS